MKHIAVGLLLLGLLAGCAGQPETDEPAANNNSQPPQPTAHETENAAICLAEAGESDIPERPVTGLIRGKRFMPEKAIFNKTVHTISFRQGEAFIADQELEIFTFADEEIPENKKWIFQADDTPTFDNPPPHVWFKWVEAEGEAPETEIFMGDYTMYLSFGEPEGDQLPGKLYVCVPGETPYRAAGTFTATIE